MCLQCLDASPETQQINITCWGGNFKALFVGYLKNLSERAGKMERNLFMGVGVYNALYNLTIRLLMWRGFYEYLNVFVYNKSIGIDHSYYWHTFKMLPEAKPCFNGTFHLTAEMLTHLRQFCYTYTYVN